MSQSTDTTLVHCSRCNTTKTRTEFYPNPYNPKWYRTPCKECLRSERRRIYREKGGADRSYAQVLRDRHGITLEQYEQMVRTQGNRCAICRRPEAARNRNGAPRRLAVDHDHGTGRIRELLCVRCNAVVWALEDNHTTLPVIQAYIDKHRAAFAEEI